MNAWTILGALVLVAAGSVPLVDEAAPSAANTAQPAATDHHVHIEDFAMEPDPLALEAGDTVTWHNHDSVSHTATADDGSWDTGTIASGETATIAFDESDDHSYHCAVHPDRMTGYTLSVTEPDEPPTVAIETPEHGQLLEGEAGVAGTASDPDGDVERVEIRLDEDPWRTVDGTTEWSATIDTRPLPDGEHTIEARSFDGASYSQPDAVTVVTDNPHPDLAVRSLAADPGPTETVLTVEIGNEGEAAAASTSLALRYDAEQAGGTIGSEPVPELGVGDAVELTRSWDTTGKAGAFEVTAEVDPEGAVLDVTPGNDQRTETVCLPETNGATCVVPGTEAPG